VVDTRGEVVGEHDGIHRVTIGQRRGLRVRGHDRRYALRVIAETRTVVVGDPHEAEVDGLEIGEPTWLRDPAPGITRGSLHVQIRHRAAPVAAAVELDGRGGRVRVRFAAPVRAVAPGQAAVVYDGDEVLGGGWIASAT
jgi:tRNA-specific 2-thiouridylase